MCALLVAGLVELGLQFGVEPRDCVGSRHKPALLQCSSPSPNVSFQWTLDNRPLPLVNNSRLQLLSNGSLYFKKVRFHMLGYLVQYQFLADLMSKKKSIMVALGFETSTHALPLRVCFLERHMHSLYLYSFLHSSRY